VLCEGRGVPVQLEEEEDVTEDGLARPSSDLVVESCVRTESWRYLTGYYNDALDNRKRCRYQPSPTISSMLTSAMRHYSETRRHSYREAPRLQG